VAEAGTPAPKRVVVIGAGIVGVASALYLQRDGHRVTLIDRGEPGEGTSFGNAGAVTRDSCVPLAMPGFLRKVPRMMLDPQGPLIVRWGYLPWLAPWLLGLVRASHPERVEAISRALADICDRVEPAWHELTRQCGTQDLLRPLGWLKAYSTDAGFAATKPERDLMTRRGRSFEILRADELRQLEPNLAPMFRHGFFQSRANFLLNPGRMVKELAKHFAAAGGTVRKAEAVGFDLADGHRRVLLADGGAEQAETIVLAAGAWSRGLARRLGARARLDTERGYHLMLPHAEPGLNRPTVWGEHYLVLSPMEHGIRLASGVELAGLDAPADFARIRGLLPLAKEMLPSLDTREQSAWMGFRPSMPDSLPVIGPSPRHRDVFLAFGHGHLGMGQGPATGRIVADLVAGRDPGFDLSPFRPGR
jgi:D-amino-acid dehydrogenase